jgi:argininosuccinate lyase
MAEKKTDAPATNMLWGGRFTGSIIPGHKLRIQYTNLAMPRRD